MTAMFNNCSSLTSLEIPESIVDIDRYAFQNCNGLADDNGFVIINHILHYYCEEDADVRIPESVTRINGGAFMWNSTVIGLTIPASVTSIDNTAFEYCTELETITFEGNAPVFGDEAFLDLTVTAYYPAGNATWTEEVMQSYGGNITWVKVGEVFEIVTQPESRNVAAGESVSFTVEATGEELTYQWQYRSSSTRAWATTTVSGNKTNTITVSGTTGRDGYQYRCKITDAEGNELFSDPVTLRVTGIKTQPDSQNIKVNDTTEISVVATGAGLTYQWQYRKNDTDTWKTTTVSGNKTDTLTIQGTLARDGYQYRCKVTDSEGNVVYSNGATLHVTGIKSNPVDQSVLKGDEVTFTVTATGAELKYQWQYRKSDTDTWKTTTVSGNKTDTITMEGTTARDGYQYRCKVTDGEGNVAYSAGAVLRVTGIKTQPASYSGAVGERAEFHVVATGEGLTYLWQYRSSASGTWKTTTQSGYKTATLSVPVTESRNGYQYRCQITDADGNVIYTDAAVLSLGGVTIEEHPESQNILVGDTVTFTVAATGNELTYQWQYRSSPTRAWSNTTVSGNKTDTITVAGTTGRDGYQYRCKVTDAEGNEVYSEGATLRVTGIKTQPASKTVAVGEKAVFSVTATGEGLTYLWQYRSSASGTWKTTTQSGYKTNALTISGTTARNGFQYRCQVTDADGNVVYSNAATLTVE